MKTSEQKTSAWQATGYSWKVL